MATANKPGFRPHDWGAFFNLSKLDAVLKCTANKRFRPHDWGAFFNSNARRTSPLIWALVFVPMIGELFSILVGEWGSIEFNAGSFRPHDWGAFFNKAVSSPNTTSTLNRVFVPMIGELFSILREFALFAFSIKAGFRPHDWGAFFN